MADPNNPLTPRLNEVEKQLADNLIINGAFDFWQRGTFFSPIANASYFADRFYYTEVGTAAHILGNSVDVPTYEQSGYNFKYSAHLLLSTPQDVLTTNQQVRIATKLEGNFVKDLYDKNIVLSFWVKATKVGTTSIVLRNGAGDRNYISQYTINQSETWERKVITIPHSSAGSWTTDESTGLEVLFILAVGPDFETANINQWIGTGDYSGIGQDNFVETGSTNFKITGIMLHEGEDFVPFQRAGRNYQEELQLCMRYFEKTAPIDEALGSNAGRILSFSRAGDGNVFFPYRWRVEKRAIPVINTHGSPTAGVGFGNIQKTGFELNGSITVSGSYTMICSGDAEL